MTRIELDENDRTGRVEVLPQEVAAALADTGLVEVRPGGGDRWLVTTPTNMVGAVRVGDLDVVVRPKASFASLLFMLGYARDPGFAPDQFDGIEEDDLWPLVGETLARLAHTAMLRGVQQGYVTREDSLAVLKGRLRASEQMARRPGMRLPVAVQYDDYAVDIPENRILRTALHRIAFVPRMPKSLRQRLTHLNGRLQGATLLLPGAPLPAWRSSRLNERYVPALRLAEVVLRCAGLGTVEGGKPVASFVVNMATVFEDFLTVALREAFTRISNGRTDGQYGIYLDVDKRISIRPDIVHIRDGRPAAVIDAKYKLSDELDNYPTQDFYQMHAYCTVLDLDRGFLVYAGSSGDHPRSRTIRVQNTNKAMVPWPINVTKTPRQLVDETQVLAQTCLATKTAPTR